MLAAVEASHIFEVIWVSLVAGVFVTVAYSLVVLGMARSADAARNGRNTVAVAYAGIAFVAFATFAGAVVFGVHIMLSKG